MACWPRQGSPDVTHGDIEVRRTLPGERPEAARVLCEAFSSSPATMEMFGSSIPVPARRMRRLYEATLSDSGGTTLVAMDRAGQIVGVLHHADAPKCEPTGLEAVRLAVAAVRSLGLRFLRAGALFRQTAKRHPQWPHRHLVVLGVPPSHQRQGIGGLMLTRFVEQADADGVSCYLETDTAGAMDLYERHGFRTVASDDVGSVTFRYMWRYAGG